MHASADLPEWVLPAPVAAPEDNKPNYCSQKYVGHISMATNDLAMALTAFSKSHNSAVEEARQEVVEFYEVRTQELGATIEEQNMVIRSLEQSMGKLGDQLTSKKIDLERTSEELKKAVSSSKALQRTEADSKATLQRAEQQLLAATQDLTAKGELLANRTAAIVAMEEESKEMEKALGRAEAAVLKLEKENKMLEGSVGELTAEAKEAKAAVARAKKEAEALGKAKAAMEADLKEARKGQTSGIDAIKELQKQVEELNGKVKDKSDAAAAAQKKQQAAVQKEADLEKQVAALTAELNGLKQERDGLKKEAAAKAEAVKKLEGHVAELERKLKQQQDAWQAAQGKWDKEKAAMEGKLEQARSLFDVFVTHNTKVQSLLLRLQKYLQTEVAQILKQTEEIVQESKMETKVESIVTEIRNVLTVS